MTTATTGAEELSGSSYDMPTPPAVDRQETLHDLFELARRAPDRHPSAATPALDDVRAGRVNVFEDDDEFLASLNF